MDEWVGLLAIVHLASMQFLHQLQQQRNSLRRCIHKTTIGFILIHQLSQTPVQRYTRCGIKTIPDRGRIRYFNDAVVDFSVISGMQTKEKYDYVAIYYFMFLYIKGYFN